ncbi:Ig-like domain-containing protein [Solibacillus silvestris]|uniref:Ig-like domain-containing protein n=1 Tax=Solibacillus silvestris TaxID=76853 RepID=UPI003F7DB95E
MVKSNLMMSLFIPIVFSGTLLITNNSDTKEWKSYSNIAVNKEWTITFNQNIAADSISNSVYLIDSNNQQIDVTTSLSGKRLIVTPASNLNYNSTYKIVVTNSLKSTKGKAMNQKIIIPFTTAPEAATAQAFKTFSSEYDLLWNMPSADYSQFHLIGAENNIEVAGYETRIGKTMFGINIGDSREAVRAKYGSPLAAIMKENTKYRQNYNDKYNEETSGTYLIGGQYVTFFYDAHKNFSVRSVLWIEAGAEMSKPGFFAAPSTSLRNGFEDLMIHLINEARVAEGLHPLIYTPEHNPIARSHSASMANNDYFGHVDLQGLRGGARMKNGGMTFNWWGENLAFGQYSAIHAHEALMNSLSHRENILREQFTHAFVGVDFNDNNRPYFTINFYSL